jgi:ubiquinone/menaquinone biosynthesis C-methylase UbiE
MSAESGTAPIKAISHFSTNDKVVELITPLIGAHSRVLDVGAGHGAMSQRLADYVSSRYGGPIGDRVSACDTAPEIFQSTDVRCSKIEADGRLPYDDASFDIVCSLEVVEHVEDQFKYCRELVRVLAPGGTVIISTPNILNMNSRWRAFCTGFPVLFDPLSLDEVDAVHTSGHIHPVSYYYLAYAMRRAGADHIHAFYDRIKRSAIALWVLSIPVVAVRNFLFTLRLTRKLPAIMRQNEPFLRECRSLGMMWSRSIILVANRPSSSRR